MFINNLSVIIPEISLLLPFYRFRNINYLWFRLINLRSLSYILTLKAIFQFEYQHI